MWTKGAMAPLAMQIFHYVNSNFGTVHQISSLITTSGPFDSVFKLRHWFCAATSITVLLYLVLFCFFYYFVVLHPSLARRAIILLILYSMKRRPPRDTGVHGGSPRVPAKSATLAMELVSGARFFLPTGRLKPPAFGSGKPDQFDRLLEKNQRNSNSKPKMTVQPVSTS